MRFPYKSSPFWTHVCPMFEDMFRTLFTPCFKICLHHIYICVYTMIEWMFPAYLKICSHNVRGHVCNMFWDKFTPCLMTCFNHVWRQIYTMLITHLCIVWNMFTQYLKTYYAFTIFKEISLSCLKTWLHNLWIHYKFEFNFFFRLIYILI